MALKGFSNRFTKKELIEFNIMNDVFSDFINIGTGEDLNSFENKIIKINSKEFSVRDISYALKCTGLPQIEQYIGNLL